MNDDKPRSTTKPAATGLDNTLLVEAWDDLVALVVVHRDDMKDPYEPLTLSPEDARELARILVEAADNAEPDKP